MKKTVCLDFDGVMNTYTKWMGEDELYEPREGLREFLQWLHDKYKIVIHSTRSAEKISEWLEKHSLENLIDEVTNVKPIAVCYLDDRGICFVGSYEMAKAQIENFSTYWE